MRGIEILFRQIAADTILTAVDLVTMSGRPFGPKDTNTKKRKLRKVEFVFVSFEPQGLPDIVYVGV